MSNKKKMLEELFGEIEYLEERTRNVVYIKLGSLMRTHKGKKPKDLINFKRNENSLPYVNIDLMTGVNKSEIQYADKNGNVILCNTQDILMVWDGARSGFVGRGVAGIIGSTLSKIEIPMISYDYLYNFLKFKYEYLNKNTKGSGIPHVDPLVLNEIEIPLYSLSEQKRISDKIEILFLKINEAKRMIEEVKENIKYRKIAILDGIFKKEYPIKKLNELVVEKGIFDGPFGSNLKTTDYRESGARVIRLENIGYLAFDELKKSFISLDKFEELKRHTVKEGDIIFASFITENIRACILPKLTEETINKSDCFCIRCNEDIIDSKYLLYYLSSRNSYLQLEKHIHGATRPRINLTQLKSLDVPVPSLEEQYRITSELEKLLEHENKIFKFLDSLSKEINTLKQTILSKAFKGELGTYDSTDESAIELLKTILQENL